MSSNSFKLAVVFLLFINSISFSGCYLSRVNELDREILELKSNVSKLEKDRLDEKQQVETRLKALEEGFKSNNSRIDELMQRNPIVGGRVEEEQLF